MNYSPPPWTVRKGDTGRTIIVADDNMEVAFVLRHDKYRDGNANLIAAAPHLLQALEIIANEIKDPEISSIAKMAIERAVTGKITN